MRGKTRYQKRRAKDQTKSTSDILPHEIFVERNPIFFGGKRGPNDGALVLFFAPIWRSCGAVRFVMTSGGDFFGMETTDQASRRSCCRSPKARLHRGRTKYEVLHDVSPYRARLDQTPSPIETPASDDTAERRREFEPRELSGPTRRKRK